MEGHGNRQRRNVGPTETAEEGEKPNANGVFKLRAGEGNKETGRKASSKGKNKNKNRNCLEEENSILLPI